MLSVESVSSDTILRIDVSFYAHTMIFNDSSSHILSFSDDGINFAKIVAMEGLDLTDFNADSLYIKSYSPGLSCPFRVISRGNRNVVYPSHQADLINQQSSVDKSASYVSKFIKIPQKIGAH